MTSAVPRSGCAAISSTAAAPTPIIGPAAVRRLWASLGRAAMIDAECRTSASFISSAGWNCSGPGADPAPRAVDLDAEAGDQHEQQQDERDQQQVRRVAADRLEPLARDHLHHHEPDRAVGEVLDEVGGAVAVALEQRARARCRVDHHRAAREQAQGRGEQQPVLERLRLLASVHRSWFRHPRARPLPVRSGDERAEVLAARLVVGVLVEGGAGRREQDDLAGARRGARRGDRALEIAAVVQRHAGGRRAPRRSPARSRRSGRRRGPARPPARRAARSRRPCALPPRIRWTPPSNDSRPAIAEATFVALESLT